MKLLSWTISAAGIINILQCTSKPERGCVGSVLIVTGVYFKIIELDGVRCLSLPFTARLR